jgi:dCMP deaminase
VPLRTSTARPDLDTYFLRMLKLVASRSTCARRAVGAIIVDAAGHVLSTGYNGVPSKMVHCIQIPCQGAKDPSGDSSRCLAVHAELNAIQQCFRLDLAHVMYCSCTPCFTCAKSIMNTSIWKIVCQEGYTDLVGVNLLRDNGRRVEVKTGYAEE